MTFKRSWIASLFTHDHRAELLELRDLVLDNDQAAIVERVRALSYGTDSLAVTVCQGAGSNPTAAAEAVAHFERFPLRLPWRVALAILLWPFLFVWRLIQLGSLDGPSPVDPES